MGSGLITCNMGCLSKSKEWGEGGAMEDLEVIELTKEFE